MFAYKVQRRRAPSRGECGSAARAAAAIEARMRACGVAPFKIFSDVNARAGGEDMRHTSPSFWTSLDRDGAFCRDKSAQLRGLTERGRGIRADVESSAVSMISAASSLSMKPSLQVLLRDLAD